MGAPRIATAWAHAIPRVQRLAIVVEGDATTLTSARGQQLEGRRLVLRGRGPLARAHHLQAIQQGGLLPGPSTYTTKSAKSVNFFYESRLCATLTLTRTF